MALTLAIGVCVTHMTDARVLFLNHFDHSLDADHSLYGEPAATAKGLALSPAGTGQFNSQALDATDNTNTSRDASVLYDAVNLDSQRGTIEMWVQPDFDADIPESHTNDTFRYFLSAPLGEKGFLALYYCYYRYVMWQPFLFFHINLAGQDHIINVKLAGNDKLDGLLWKKDSWHFLAATWTPMQMRLFVDGKLVAEQKLEKPLDLPPVSGPIAIGNSHTGGRPAHALIDDVRISDSVLPAGDKTIPVPAAPLTAAEEQAAIEAGGFATLKQPDVRQYECYRVEQPPKIDGVLDDEVWQKLPAWSGFLTFGSVDNYPTAQTEIKLCRDDQSIYVAATLWEDRLERLKVNAAPGPQENVQTFSDDSLELFFGAKRGELPNCQIGINSRNAVCDLWHAENRADFKWNGTYQSATGRTNNAWTIEFAFPYSNLGVTPQIGDVWGFRAGRNRAVGDFLNSAVNYASTGYQNAPQFARLNMAGALPRRDVVKAENLLNADYLAAARTQLNQFVGEARRQLDLAAAAQPPLPAEEIRALVDECHAVLAARQRQPVARWNQALLKLQTGVAQLERFAYRLANTASASARLPGPELAGIRKEAGIWYLASEQLVAAVEPAHGMVAGVWDRATGQRLIVNGYLRYDAQTKTNQVITDERTDRVVKAVANKERLTLYCENPALPGVKLQKAYWLESVCSEARSEAECRSADDRARQTDATPLRSVADYKQTRLLCRRLETIGKPRELTLFTATSRTLFDEDYRKPSFYHRIFCIGTLGDGRSFVPAAEVTQTVPQRAWFNATEGRSQFVLLNPQTGNGIAEYLYKENDVWTFPGALPMSYWTPFGWDMGFAGTFLGNPRIHQSPKWGQSPSEKGTVPISVPGRAVPYSTEIRYHLFHGDRFTFHREFASLPEYAAVRAAGAPDPKTRRVAGVWGGSPAQALADPKYLDSIAGPAHRQLWRPDDLLLGSWAFADRRWPDFPAADGREMIEPHPLRPGVVVSSNDCRTIRAGIAKLKQTNPQLLVNIYSFITDIFHDSQTMRDHPDWIARGRDGAPLEGYFGSQYVRANWSPEFVDQLIAGLVRTYDYFDMDVCYLDFGVGPLLADWGRGEVVNFAVYFDFLKRLRAELHQRGKLLWLNSFVGQPFFDIGFYESWPTSPHERTPWRDAAEIALWSRFYLPPGGVLIPLYWRAGDQFRESNQVNETRYIDMVVAAGATPCGCYLDPYHIHFPDGRGGADWFSISKYLIAVPRACQELRDSQIADAGLQPAWWSDPNTTLEAYTLRMPDNTRLVNVISHEPKPQDVTLTVDLKKMGFDPGKRTFIWQLLRRDYEKYPKQVPVPENWEQLFSSRVCRSVRSTDFSRNPSPAPPEGGTPNSLLRYTIPQLPPDRVCVTVLTQTPAALFAVGGIGTQTLLPATLGCQITGRADESAKRVTLRVTCDQPVEVIAWWPKTWGNARITVAGRELPGAPVSFGEETYLRFALEKGDWEVTADRQP